VKTLTLITLSLSLSVLSACSKISYADTPSSNTEVTQAANPQHIHITQSMINPPLPGRDISAGYFSLQNDGPTDRLIAARSSISPIVELHTHIEDQGVMRMRRIEGIEIGAGETLSFEPGGYHLMLFKTDISAGQKQAEITLVFENAGEMTLTAPIQSRNSQSAGSSGSGSSGSGSGSGSGYGSGKKASKPAKKD